MTRSAWAIECPTRGPQIVGARNPGRRAASIAAVALATSLSATPALPWGALGHEVAGQLADALLADSARRSVDELLQGEPLAEASHWADRMRSDPAPFWQDTAGPYHYITVPRGSTYSDHGAPPQGDALSALTRFEEQLRDPKTTTSERQLALRFAVHIIQDLHQPLHVGNGTDRGGNDTAVIVAGENSNLHRLWDRQILDSTGRDRQQWVAHLRRSGHLRTPREDDAQPLTWVRESIDLRDRLYPAPRTVDASYYRWALPKAEERLALAAVRTAAWLNAVLGPGDGSQGTVTEPPAAPRQPWWKRLFSS